MNSLVKTILRHFTVFSGPADRPKAGESEAEIGKCSNGYAEIGSGPLSKLVTGHPLPETVNTNVATPDDIFYCFRLLLGRNPNPEEWPGHSSRAGENLENVVSSYVSSREFAQRGMLNKTYHADVHLVRLPTFSIFVSGEDLAVGRHILNGQIYEPHITALLTRYVKPGMAVLDIGANIGYLTMLIASLVQESGLVIAVEPNPDNVKLLEATRRLNGFNQVQVMQVAAGRETGILALNVSHSNGMTGELPGDVEAILGARLVPCLALDILLPTDRRIDLIKIDIEGAEYNALLGLGETLTRWHPLIVSEFSPGSLPGISECTGPEYLRFLIAMGYQIGVIEADGSVTPFEQDVEGIMDAYGRSGVDHIDLLVSPVGA
jgi:FkbM family methyltransferase